MTARPNLLAHHAVDDAPTNAPIGRDGDFGGLAAQRVQHDRIVGMPEAFLVGDAVVLAGLVAPDELLTAETHACSDCFLPISSGVTRSAASTLSAIPILFTRLASIADP